METCNSKAASSRDIHGVCGVRVCPTRVCKSGHVGHPLCVWRWLRTDLNLSRSFCCCIAGKLRQAHRAFPSRELGKLPPRDVGQWTNETRAFPQGHLGLLQGLRARRPSPPLSATPHSGAPCTHPNELQDSGTRESCLTGPGRP